MSTGHRFLKFVRQIHLYLGVFTAPMLLFFAITGGLQTFSLHETTHGSSYTPPAWLVTLSQLHKKQTTVIPVRRPRPPEATGSGTNNPRIADAPATAPQTNAASDARAAAPASGPIDNAGSRPEKNLLSMKIFFALVALSLMFSTLTGLYMAYRFTRNAKRIAMVLLAGIIVPLLLTLL